MTNELIKKRSNAGWKGLFWIYWGYDPNESKPYEAAYNSSKRIIKYGYLPPFIFSVLFTVFLSFTLIEAKLYEYLLDLSTTFLNILPGILGLNLAAFTLFAAFGGTEFLKSLAKFDEKKPSYYQKNNAVFAISLTLQLTALLLSFLINSICKIEITVTNINIYKYGNLFTIWFLMFISLSSLLTLKDIIINLFNTTQIYHLNLFRDKIKEISARRAQQKD